MNWPVALWLVIASTCLTLAVIHLHVWLRQRQALGNAAFAVLAISVAGMSYVEMRMMYAETPQAFARFLWWYHVPVWSGLVSLVVFVRVYLRAGWAWLGWTAVGLRTLALLLNLFMSPGLHFREITALDDVTLLGDTVHVPRGVTNPWLALAHLSLLAVILFIASAMADLWRRRQRRRAVTIGGSLIVFVTVGTLSAVLAFWGLARLPVVTSLLFLPILCAMAFELGVDLIEAVRVAAELAVKRDELEHLSRVATLTELSGTLAHEINQPLAAIMSNAEAAQRLLQADAPDLAEVREILGDIVAADERAGQVIQRMRSFLQRRAPMRKRLSLNRVVADVAEFMRADVARRGVRLDLALDDSLPDVEADPVPIEQVLVNIITNGCDAMRGVAHDERTLRVATAVDGGTACVRITDAGCGLPEPPDRVFAPFYTTKADGLGMGLAISRSIVAAHGGRLWAERNHPQGTTFAFCLPLASAPVAATPGEAR